MLRKEGCPPQDLVPETGQQPSVLLLASPAMSASHCFLSAHACLSSAQQVSAISLQHFAVLS